MTNFEKVGIFMKTFGQEVKTKAELSNNKINELRISLINEELEELKKANFVYFSGGSPTHLYDSIHDSLFFEELINVERRGIVAGCSAGAMIMGEKMIKGIGLNYLPNTIVIPHYGESFYSWISNTVKMLNRGKYKLLCLEKDTYFIKDGEELRVLGKQNVHIIYKKEHHTFSNGDTINPSLLK